MKIALDRALSSERGPTEPELENPTVGTTRVVVETAVPLGTLLSSKLERDLATTDLESLKDPSDKLISDALDRALDCIRQLQTGYAALKQRATKTVCLQDLPLLVPYGIRGVSTDDPEDPLTGVLLANDRFERFQTRPTLDTEDRQKLLHFPTQSPHAAPIQNLKNKALTAFRKYGSTQECMAMLGATSELLFNSLIQSLHWEDGLIPEESAKNWKESLIKRIAQEVPHRIGGNWSLDSSSPYTAWKGTLYQTRNRLLHGGYTPTPQECESAIKSLDDLISYVGILIVQGASLRNYPRTIQMFYPNRVDNHKNKFSHVLELSSPDIMRDWTDTFQRWSSTHSRILSEPYTPRTSTIERSELLLILDPTLESLDKWILRDPETRCACSAEVDEDKLSISPHCIGAKRGRRNAPTVVRYSDCLDAVTTTGPWVEEYRLHPMFGVMVDGSDLSDGRPVATP